MYGLDFYGQVGRNADFGAEILSPDGRHRNAASAPQWSAGFDSNNLKYRSSFGTLHAFDGEGPIPEEAPNSRGLTPRPPCVPGGMTPLMNG